MFPFYQYTIPIHQPVKVLTIIGLPPCGRGLSVIHLPLCDVVLLANWAVSDLAPKSHLSADFPG